MTRKTMIILAFMVAIRSASIAQGLGDWFNQKQQQKKQLLEQIAALKVYLDHTRKGYEVLKYGTDLTGDIRNLDKYQHADYFNDRKKVSPTIKKHDRIGDIIRLYETMLKRRNITLTRAREGGHFTSGEMSEMNRLFASIAAEADMDLDELLMVATDGQVSMSDDERIARIEKLYAIMQKRHGVQLSLSQKILSLAEGRNRKQQYLKTLKGITVKD